ncbi:MAG TPA: AraC family transcriptional regulator [Galbitalea sp.]|jgi:AraC-like DNA-binding protein|nr:AraC family transcriptional regulator [Galbitalea sp.]
MELDALRDTIRRHASNYHGPSAIDGLTITETDSPTDARPGISEPSIAVVVQGRKRTVVGDGVFDYASGDFLVVSLEVPLIGQVTEASQEVPFVGFGVKLVASEIASLLLEAGAVSGGEKRGLAGFAVAPAGVGFLQAASRLVGLLDTPEDVAILAPVYRRELLWRLLTGAHGLVVRQIGLADGSLADIARTVRWIREHHRDAIKVEQLAEMASMSATSFHRHFRSVTCMTPIQYQKAIRLQEARLSLISSPRDVAEVAHAVGYDSSSQFSREYRRRFGAPPGRDASRLRSAELQTVVVP